MWWMEIAFWTHYGHFEYIVMPFNLTNAVVVFQHLTNNILVNIWMILWSFMSMTSSFLQRTQKTMNIMYILLWTSSKKLKFMPNWRSVNYMKLKWSPWIASFLKMTFTWILIPLWIGLLLLMFNVLLDSPTSIDVLFHIISW